MINLEQYKKMLFNCGYFDLDIDVPEHGRFLEMLANVTGGLGLIQKILVSDEYLRIDKTPTFFDDTNRVDVMNMTQGFIDMTNWLCMMMIDNINYNQEMIKAEKSKRK